MGFNSIEYILFLPLVTLIYYLLPAKLRWILLLSASYLFYMMWSFKLSIIIISVTFFAYFFGLLLEKHRKKWLMLAGVFSVIALLIYYKYFNFFIDIINSISTKSGSLFQLNALDIILPVGISFYTFQAISYVIDVYRKKLPAEKHPGYFALYISFFPQLVAGPIEKAGNLLPQLREKHSFKKENILEGGKILLWGFFKKIVIADTLILYCNNIYNNVYSESVSGFDFIFVQICFAYYIYCDFSAYSDIATGSARLLGIKLQLNFNKPFSSMNFREFWTRWHITLSQWMKEYVFDPMGGIVRNNTFRTLLNVFVVFVLVGLWHGASYNFIAFGVVSSIYIIIDYSSRNLRKRLFEKSGISKNKSVFKMISRTTVTLLFASLAFFFATKNIDDAIYMLRNITDFSTPFLKPKYFLWILFLIALLEIFQFIQKKEFFHPFAGIKNTYLRMAVYNFLLFFILLFCDRGSVNFHYYQF